MGEQFIYAFRLIFSANQTGSMNGGAIHLRFPAQNDNSNFLARFYENHWRFKQEGLNLEFGQESIFAIYATGTFNVGYNQSISIFMKGRTFIDNQWPDGRDTAGATPAAATLRTVNIP